ncbi:sensor histidine kinase [Streptomyces sp. NBC_00893]|uniref:sensor histidine kinase n=1 Tax=Streptomyces sp. NBC_00893 TaxID=2975862 RepID=UPI0022547F1B|nr:histidine kinase [Streptomyces sp. NBC_00893]MCX4845319.1 histidine kinase [Streptomyces sp. NBC_00893]
MDHLAFQLVRSRGAGGARELHDIVSHNLSLIAVKAGVAGHVADADPQEARDALKIIEETSRSAPAEMRRTLGVLRGRGASYGGAAEGVRVTVHRIVQEAVTNVVRHASPTRCRVTVGADAREVRTDVVDEGPPVGRRAEQLPGVPDLRV